MRFCANSDPCPYTPISSLCLSDQEQDAPEEGAVLLPHLEWQIQHPDSLWYLHLLVIGSRLERYEMLVFFSSVLLRWETHAHSLFNHVDSWPAWYKGK